MLIRRGKALRFGHVQWHYDGQRIDTWGLMFDRINSCLHWPVSGVMNDEQYWCCLVNVLACSLWTDNTRKGFEIRIALMCLPFVYLTPPHVTKSPRPSPLYLHTASDQILEAGTAWEQGYSTWVFCHNLHFQVCIQATTPVYNFCKEVCTQMKVLKYLPTTRASSTAPSTLLGPK